MTTATEIARRCTQCGANPARHAARFCEYCGTELPRLPVVQPAASASASGDVAARFAAIEGLAEFEELLNATPAIRNPVGTASLVGSTMTLVAVALIGLVVTGTMATAFPPLALIPVAIVGFAVFQIANQWIKSARFEREELRREAAMILSTRTKVSGGGNDRATSTHYYATLQYADETRRELEAFEHVVGTVAHGDLGVAYTKGPFLVEFRRLKG